MIRGGDSRPTAREQIGGLGFAVLLIAPDQVVCETNPAAEVLLGTSSSRIIKHRLSDIISLQDERMVDTLEDPECQLVARGIDMMVGGRSLRVNLTVWPLAGRPGWRVLTLSDAAPGERFEEQERRPALRGPAVLAHEIKNPLAAIKGASQLLARKVGDGEQAMVALIVDEVDRIAQLIDRMQRLGRENVEPVAPVNLHEAIHRAVESVQLSTPGAVVWRQEFDPSLPSVLANHGALVQVLVNLMANARDAALTSARPRVAIRTRFVSGFVMNVIRLGRPFRVPIEVQVSDNGPGIDPDLRDHIFEPFVTGKKHGQGLGLALAQKLVRDMNGRVSHERDDAGGWTHFRVHLPIAPNEKRTPA